MCPFKTKVRLQYLNNAYNIVNKIKVKIKIKTRYYHLDIPVKLKIIGWTGQSGANGLHN
jgi:hypothetical protein